jgi:trehalose 6-phosphate synthase/phosphatase
LGSSKCHVRRIRIIYAGDDTTDEDAITALKGMAFSFRVASSHLTQTAADKRLPSTDSVLTLLQWVEKHMAERKLKTHMKKLARVHQSPPQVHVESISKLEFQRRFL